MSNSASISPLPALAAIFGDVVMRSNISIGGSGSCGIAGAEQFAARAGEQALPGRNSICCTGLSNVLFL